MSGLADRSMEMLAAAIRFAGPATVFGVVGALAGLLVAYATYRLAGALVRRIGRRAVRVESLVALGVSRAEIARRTGLSQDAVTMLLRVRPARRGRRKLPAPARIAALKTDRAHRRNRDWNPQAVAGTQVNHAGTATRKAARPLPFPGASHGGLTRSEQAA
jgi:hypothetical protein